MARPLTPNRYKPLAEVVYEKLRDAIYQGHLRPGQRLIQTELASRMGVSRIPVREALQRLAKEGLVEHRPHRTASVRQPTPEELMSTLDTITILENVALELAMKRITDHDVAALDRIQASLSRTLEAGRTGEILSLNHRFHRTLLQLCGLPKLCECIEGLTRSYPLGLNHAVLERGKAALEEHDSIISALRARDLAGLLKASAKHSRNSMDYVLAMVRSADPGDGLNLG